MTKREFRLENEYHYNRSGPVLAQRRPMRLACYSIDDESLRYSPPLTS